MSISQNNDKEQSILTITLKYLFVLTLQIKLATESQNIWIWFNGGASGFSFCDCEGLPPGHSLPHLFIFNIKFMAILYVDYRNVLSYFVRPQININDRLFNSAHMRVYMYVWLYVFIQLYLQLLPQFFHLYFKYELNTSRVCWKPQPMEVGALFHT